MWTVYHLFSIFKWLQTQCLSVSKWQFLIFQFPGLKHTILSFCSKNWKYEISSTVGHFCRFTKGWKSRELWSSGKWLLSQLLKPGTCHFTLSQGVFWQCRSLNLQSPKHTVPSLCLKSCNYKIMSTVRHFLSFSKRLKTECMSASKWQASGKRVASKCRIIRCPSPL